MSSLLELSWVKSVTMNLVNTYLHVNWERNSIRLCGRNRKCLFIVVGLVSSAFGIWCKQKTFLAEIKVIIFIVWHQIFGVKVFACHKYLIFVPLLMEVMVMCEIMWTKNLLAIIASALFISIFMNGTVRRINNIAWYSILWIKLTVHFSCSMAS